jgi:hypothetical protein
MSSNGSVAGLTSGPAKVADYIAITRLDHATKHVFVLPGIILALLLRGSGAGFLSAVRLMASGVR